LSTFIAKPFGDPLNGERRQLCTEEGIRDRQRRNQNDGAPNEQLVRSEATLTSLLNETFGRSEAHDEDSIPKAFVESEELL
jgi:hypothetical protein